MSARRVVHSASVAMVALVVLLVFYLIHQAAASSSSVEPMGSMQYVHMTSSSHPNLVGRTGGGYNYTHMRNYAVPSIASDATFVGELSIASHSGGLAPLRVFKGQLGMTSSRRGNRGSLTSLYPVKYTAVNETQPTTQTSSATKAAGYLFAAQLEQMPEVGNQVPLEDVFEACACPACHVTTAAEAASETHWLTCVSHTVDKTLTNERNLHKPTRVRTRVPHAPEAHIGRTGTIRFSTYSEVPALATVDPTFSFASVDAWLSIALGHQLVTDVVHKFFNSSTSNNTRGNFSNYFTSRVVEHFDTPTHTLYPRNVTFDAHGNAIVNASGGSNCQLVSEKNSVTSPTLARHTGFWSDRLSMNLLRCDFEFNYNLDAMLPEVNTTTYTLRNGTTIVNSTTVLRHPGFPQGDLLPHESILHVRPFHFNWSAPAIPGTWVSSEDAHHTIKLAMAIFDEREIEKTSGVATHEPLLYAFDGSSEDTGYIVDVCAHVRSLAPIASQDVNHARVRPLVRISSDSMGFSFTEEVDPYAEAPRIFDTSTRFGGVPAGYGCHAFNLTRLLPMPAWWAIPDLRISAVNSFSAEYFHYIDPVHKSKVVSAAEAFGGNTVPEALYFKRPVVGHAQCYWNGLSSAFRLNLAATPIAPFVCFVGVPVLSSLTYNASAIGAGISATVQLSECTPIMRTVYNGSQIPGESCTVLRTLAQGTEYVRFRPANMWSSAAANSSVGVSNYTHAFLITLQSPPSTDTSGTTTTYNSSTAQAVIPESRDLRFTFALPEFAGMQPVATPKFISQPHTFSNEVHQLAQSPTFHTLAVAHPTHQPLMLRRRAAMMRANHAIHTPSANSMAFQASCVNVKTLAIPTHNITCFDPANPGVGSFTLQGTGGVFYNNIASPLTLSSSSVGHHGIHGYAVNYTALPGTTLYLMSSSLVGNNLTCQAPNWVMDATCQIALNRYNQTTPFYWINHLVPNGIYPGGSVSNFTKAKEDAAASAAAADAVTPEQQILAEQQAYYDNVTRKSKHYHKSTREQERWAVIALVIAVVVFVAIQIVYFTSPNSADVLDIIATMQGTAAEHAAKRVRERRVRKALGLQYESVESSTSEDSGSSSDSEERFGELQAHNTTTATKRRGRSSER